MEPGLIDREERDVAREYLLLGDKPQWSPVSSTGKREVAYGLRVEEIFAAMEPGLIDREEDAAANMTAPPAGVAAMEPGLIDREEGSS